MKITATIVLFLVSANLVYAQPKIDITPGTLIDWGTVGPGTIHNSITVKNIGKEALTLKEIRVSCGCTTVPLTKKMLMPGDTAILQIGVDLHNKEGDQRKEIYIVSNDPLDSVVTVQLKATIYRDLVSSPLTFPTKMNAKVDHEVKSQVEITNIGSDTLTLQKPHFNGNGLKVRFNIDSGTRLDPGKSVKVQAFITPTLFGLLSGAVIIPSTSKYVPNMEVDMVVYAKGGDEDKITTTTAHDDEK